MGIFRAINNLGGDFRANIFKIKRVYFNRMNFLGYFNV